MASLRRKLIQLMSLKKESGGGGGLPSEYQQVEYIESHGGYGSTANNRQYMMVDYVPNSKTGFEIEYKTVNAINGTEVLFGSLSLDSNTVRTYSIRSQWQNQNAVVIRKYGVNSVIPATFNVKHSLSVDKNGNYNIDGTTGTATNFDDTFYDNMSLFARIDTSTNNPTDFASLQLYKLNFTENGVKVLDFIPCYRKSDTVIGLYEVVNGVFYTNQGTGAFTKGPDVVVTSPIYGIKRALNTDSSAWERTDDAVGLVANAQIGNTPVQNDFDSIYPWSDIISYNYDVTNDRINAYYGDSNFAFDGSNGDVLTLIPEFYYKRWQDSTYEYIQISKDEFEGSIKNEEFSIGRYTNSGTSSRPYSRSGYNPLVQTKLSILRNAVNNMGAKMCLMDWHFYLIHLLYLVEYADYNSQSKLGPGYTKNTHSTPIASGGCDILGMKSGSVDGTNDVSMIYRGIEDIYGNIWQNLDGIKINHPYIWVCYDKNNYNSEINTTNYTRLSYNCASSSGFISKLGYDSNNPLFMLPIQDSGTDSTYMCDYHNFNNTSGGNRIGGNWANGTNAGFWRCVTSDGIEAEYDSLGTRLIKLK